MTEAGDVVKLKSNKIDNPSNPSEKLRRGDSIKTTKAGSREGAIGIKIKRKGEKTPDVGKVTPFKTVHEGKTELKITPGKTTKTYTPARELTGHKEYGKENAKNKDAAFIEEARKKKQDIAYDKDQKPYRAGVTTETSTPPKLSITTPKIRIAKVSSNKAVKPKKSAEEIRSENDKPTTRKLPRIAYLRNKDAKGGISKERGRKKSESGY